MIVASTPATRALALRLNNQIYALAQTPGTSEIAAYLEACQQLEIDPDDGYDYLELVEDRPYGQRPLRLLDERCHQCGGPYGSIGVSCSRKNCRGCEHCGRCLQCQLREGGAP